ncbi:MAG: hypothetical protein ABIG61_08540 [Planctomycetota bacterium]
MNIRERGRAVLERKSVDKLPCDIWATDEVSEMLGKHLSCTSRWELIDKLNIDSPYTIDPPYTGPKLKEGFDIWGVEFRDIDYGTGVYSEVAFAPLSNVKDIGELENYCWPSANWFDYSQISQEIETHAHRPIRAGYVEPFLIYSRMRGLEQAMIDLIDNIKMIECAFDFIFDFATKQFERIFDAADGRIDITVPSEDLGSQTGPLFSLEIFKWLHKERFE